MGNVLNSRKHFDISDLNTAEGEVESFHRNDSFVKIPSNPVKCKIPLKPEDRETYILPYLFLSGCKQAGDYDFLQRNRIRYIITIYSGVSKIQRFNNMVYLPIEIRDNNFENVYQYFESACNFIMRAKRKHELGYPEPHHCLVHCQMGISRSATIVIAFLMKCCKMNLKKAYQHCLKRRPIIAPNLGFFSQLQELELYLLGDNSISTKDYIAMNVELSQKHKLCAEIRDSIVYPIIDKASNGRKRSTPCIAM